MDSAVRKIPVVENAPSTGVDYRTFFTRIHQHSPELQPLGKACHDCAVTCGFYSPYTDELAKLDTEFQQYISVRWFCHNHPDRACRGNIDRLALPPQTGRSEPWT